jgi:hypothetical protein
LPSLAVTLLKGVIYRDGDERLWAALLDLQAQVRDYMKVLDLELVLDDAEGYAFLRSRPRRRRHRRFQAATPDCTPAVVLSGEPVAGPAAQEARRVRCRRW